MGVLNTYEKPCRRSTRLLNRDPLGVFGCNVLRVYYPKWYAGIYSLNKILKGLGDTI